MAEVDQYRCLYLIPKLRWKLYRKWGTGLHPSGELALPEKNMRRYFPTKHRLKRNRSARARECSTLEMQEHLNYFPRYRLWDIRDQSYWGWGPEGSLKIRVALVEKDKHRYLISRRSLLQYRMSGDEDPDPVKPVNPGANRARWLVGYSESNSIGSEGARTLSEIKCKNLVYLGLSIFAVS